MDLGKMTDEQLIELLREGKTEITDYLMEKYKDMVRKQARAMYLWGGENDDLIQEGMIGLLKRCRIMIRKKVQAFQVLPDFVCHARCIRRLRLHSGKTSAAQFLCVDLRICQ